MDQWKTIVGRNYINSLNWHNLSFIPSIVEEKDGVISITNSDNKSNAIKIYNSRVPIKASGAYKDFETMNQDNFLSEFN